jgi:hypothetical protein
VFAEVDFVFVDEQCGQKVKLEWQLALLLNYRTELPAVCDCSEETTCVVELSALQMNAEL